MGGVEKLSRNTDWRVAIANYVCMYVRVSSSEQKGVAKEHLEVNNRTVRTLTRIPTRHCAIGSFADKLGLSTSIIAKATSFM